MSNKVIFNCINSLFSIFNNSMKKKINLSKSEKIQKLIFNLIICLVVIGALAFSGVKLYNSFGNLGEYTALINKLNESFDENSLLEKRAISTNDYTSFVDKAKSANLLLFDEFDNVNYSAYESYATALSTSLTLTDLEYGAFLNNINSETLGFELLELNIKASTSNQLISLIRLDLSSLMSSLEKPIYIKTTTTYDNDFTPLTSKVIINNLTQSESENIMQVLLNALNNDKYTQGGLFNYPILLEMGLLSTRTGTTINWGVNTISFVAS